MAGFDDRYKLTDRELGRGAWSVVRGLTLIPPHIPEGYSGNAKFVVKMIDKKHLSDIHKGNLERATADVMHEIDTLRHIPSHSNIVNFVEFFETDSHFLLIFEEVSGGDLCDLILRAGNFDEECVRRYFFQIIQAVLHCHVHNVAHRDIKPENLLVDAENNIKLTDFGLAKRPKGTPASAPVDTIDELVRPLQWLARRECTCTDIIGTPRYGAPEMFAAKFSKTTYDGFLADTWSVGVVGFILISKSFPFSSSNTATEKETYNNIMNTRTPFPPNAPQQAVSLISMLLEKDPAKRLRLHEALDHPWFDGMQECRSQSIDTVRGKPGVPETLIRGVDAEVSALQKALRRLRWEVTFRKPKEGGSTQVRASSRPATASAASSSARAGSARRPVATSSPARPTVDVARKSPVAVSPRTNSTGSVPPSRRSATPPASASSRVSGQRTPVGSASQRVSVLRNASPLARSSPAGVRRGTPAPATPTTPKGPTTPLRAPLSSAVKVSPKPASASPSRSSSTPKVTSPGVHRALGALTPSTKESFSVGDQILYQNNKATIHFFGPTTFGSGVWLGIEMIEGNGFSDGVSLVDKKRYFTCPKGKGMFVRPGQVQKV